MRAGSHMPVRRGSAPLLLHCVGVLIQCPDMSAALVLAIVLAVAIPVQLWRAHRLDPAFVARWAAGRDLTLTPENRPAVTRYLRRARALRTWGGVAGAVLPSIVEYAVAGRVQVLG